MTEIQVTAPMIIGLLAGLGTALFLGPVVALIVRNVREKRDRTPPSGIATDEWEEMIGAPRKLLETNAILGRLERMLVFFAFYLSMSGIVVGWLAFKLGSKWQTWQSIVKVPSELDGVDERSYAAARNRWGVNILQSWLIGTLANVIAGIIGLVVSIVATALATRLLT